MNNGNTKAIIRNSIVSAIFLANAVACTSKSIVLNGEPARTVASGGGQVDSSGQAKVIHVTGEKALDIINALSNGGVKMTKKGQLTTGPLLCHRDTDRGFLDDDNVDAGRTSGPVCYKSQYINPDSGSLSDSYWITESFKRAGVEEVPSMHGIVDVSVRKVVCQSDLSQPVLITNSQESIVNPARFACWLTTDKGTL